MFKLKQMLVVPFAALSTTFTSSAFAQSSLPFSPEDLVGHWVSTICEVAPLTFNGQTIYAKRIFDFSETNWIMRYTVYADHKCANPLFSLRQGGLYQLGPTVSTALSARELNFDIASVHLTPDDPSFLPVLQDANCGIAPWQLGIQQDVGSTGCISNQPISICPTTYEIVQLDRAGLRIGINEETACDPNGRATVPNRPPVRKRPPIDPLDLSKSDNYRSRNEE